MTDEEIDLMAMSEDAGRRKRAQDVRAATAHARLEGSEITPVTSGILEKYVMAEITVEEGVAAVLKLYGASE